MKTLTPRGNLWHDTAAETVAAGPLDIDRTVDLCIVGGGFTGCSAALHGAMAGLSVCLIEGRRFGHGGSGRNVGLVNAGLWSPPETIARHLPGAAAERLIEALAAGPDLVFSLIDRHAIACEPVRAGTLHLGHSRAGMADLRDRHRQQVARGAPVTLLDAAEAARRTGATGFLGGLHDARAGTVQPLAYCRGLARAAMAAGAMLHEDTPALAIAQDRGAWLVTTPRGTIRAGALILATNAYHEGTAPPAPLVPVFFFQAATEPLEDASTLFPGGEGVWDTAMVMTSMRRDAAGRLIVGAMGSLDHAGRGQHLAWAQRRMARHFPALTGARFTHSWTGRIGMTSDHMPRLLKIGPRGYAATGYNGRGIAPGTVFGRAMAQAVASGSEEGLPLPVSATHAERLVTPRAAFFESGAALTHATALRL